MKISLKKSVIAIGTLLVGSTAFAAGPDYTSLVSSVDFSSAITAIMAVASGLAGVYLAIAGARAVLRMIH